MNTSDMLYGCARLRRSPSTVAERLARQLTFGRSRVLTPVPLDQEWVFFKGFLTPSYRGMSHITDKAIAGSVPTTFLPHPSTPYPSRILPSMWLKRLWNASAARPPSGGMKDSLSSTVAKRLARRFTFGRSRVLTPVPHDQVWVFFKGFPTPSHCGMSHITDKAYPGTPLIAVRAIEGGADGDDDEKIVRRDWFSNLGPVP
ncbi:hypothetical protein GEV33_013208 [Tenebrio molitor]|uniref:Uncharacterized protein n=1 Tax=Tenebrio molitor TaxID=7067 RepID=A0A8J6H990_TENMO|nr:hypothetical protein GEV33_013208 [Tenebrio molitor]